MKKRSRSRLKNRPKNRPKKKWLKSQAKPKVPPQRVLDIVHPKMRVLTAARHHAPLKLVATQLRWVERDQTRGLLLQFGDLLLLHVLRRR